MTKFSPAQHVWKDPFSPEEVLKTPTEKQLGFNSFADALIKAARQKEAAAERQRHFQKLKGE